MIFNTLLKDWFKVPLFPHLGTGYAFPSGHMHAATIFYGYLIHTTKDIKIKYGLTTLLSIIGFALIYCRFHDLYDVIGAVGFSIVEIFIFHTISKHLKSKNIDTLILIISTILMTILYIYYKAPTHTWMAFYTLLSIVMCMYLFNENKKYNYAQKL